MDNASCIWSPPVPVNKIINYNTTKLTGFNSPRAFMNPPLADKPNTNYKLPILHSKNHPRRME